MLHRKRALDRLAKEKYLYTRRAGGDINVCVIYPNTYPLGMANLGFQSIYQIFAAHPQVAADRAFLPERDEWPAIKTQTEQLRSFEQGRALSDFEVLAFSISFETDYLNLITILRLAGIPLRRGEREGRHYPLIIAGGSAVFLNPEPIADYIDLFLVGEGEEMTPEFLAEYRRAREVSGPGRTALAQLQPVSGEYRPANYFPTYDESGRLIEMNYRGVGQGQVKRRLIRDLNHFRTASMILTEESVFGDMYLVEASRGCQWGCRFCAAGFMYRPIRYRSPENLIAEAAKGLAERSTIGLVGAEMASVPGVATIAQSVADRGGRLSPSSLKADCISPELAKALGRNGNRSVTIAPEAGSERMRKVINKNLREPEILDAAAMLVGPGGVNNLKLYFMIGLPEEQSDDVSAIARLTGAILERMRTQRKSIGRVTVSLNPFVPKPWTPFQWDPMESVSALKQKIADLRKQLGRLGGASIELDAESPRDAYFQTLVWRGDRRVGRILERLDSADSQEPGARWRELSAIRREASGELPDPDFYVTRRYAHEEVLPWDFIDHHIHKWFLQSERKKAHHEHQSKPCDVTRCTVCGAC